MPIRYILLESTRQLRNWRSLAFTFVIPVALLLIFGSIYGGAGQHDASAGLPWLIVTTLQMAAYGGMMSALGQAFAITTERAAGWNRQLRVTPLSGTGYLLSKVAAALIVSLTTILLLCLVSVVVLGARMDALHWVLAIGGLWLGVIPFALLAVTIGLFARPDFAQPLFVIVFIGLAVLGGLWIPLDILPAWISEVAQVFPSYWLNKLGQFGARGSGQAGIAIGVLAAWTAALAAIVVWRYRRDAARA